MARDKTNKPFNLLLTGADYAHLMLEAEEAQVSAGAFLRQLLRRFVADKTAAIPSCMAGTPCFFSQMHPRVQNRRDE